MNDSMKTGVTVPKTPAKDPDPLTLIVRELEEKEAEIAGLQYQLQVAQAEKRELLLAGARTAATKGHWDLLKLDIARVRKYFK